MFSRRLAARYLALTGAGALVLGSVAAWELKRAAPAPSLALQSAKASAPASLPNGAALFAWGDFGSIDLDTLETTAMPWPLLASVLALAETGGNPNHVEWTQVATAFKRFGFLYPTAIDGQGKLPDTQNLPLGFSLGRIERTFPPLRISAINIGCAACHAGPKYTPDGKPDPTTAVLGRPNTALDLEAFSQHVYRALQAGLANEAAMTAAMARLFPAMTTRERLSLSWIVMPRVRARLATIAATNGKPLAFHNGLPGLTNGVASLKVRLGLTNADAYDASTGFVSIPDLADRTFRSAVLADGAYAPKNSDRFRPVNRAEADTRDHTAVAAIASFFMVPSMGLSPQRTEAAIPQLATVLDFLRSTPPPRFPGPIDTNAATAGRDVFARACANCHGTYDTSVTTPRLLSFPNWAGDVGTDRSRLDAFTPALQSAIAKTGHGQRYIDAAVTQQKAAPLLSGVWSSAPYFTNGSIPTLRHLLTPDTRPQRFMLGGHKLSLYRRRHRGRNARRRLELSEGLSTVCNASAL